MHQKKRSKSIINIKKSLVKKRILLSRKPRKRRHSVWEVGVGCIQGTEFMSKKNDLKRSNNMKMMNNELKTVVNDTLQVIQT